jgi:hypothetical protein
MEFRDVYDEITFDIQRGVYSQYPKLKKRLKYIAEKLLKTHFVSNSNLTKGEIRTLKDNEYI